MKILKYVLFFFILSSCKEDLEKTIVEEQDIVASVYASGIIKSENQYQVFPKSSGILKQIFVNEGDLIKKNQLLFSISNESSELSKQNAEILAKFNDIGNNQEKINDFQLNVDLAKTKFITDSTNFQRQKVLFEKKISSKAELEQAELLYLSSKTNYVAAKNRLADLKKQLKFSDSQSKKNLQISESFQNDFSVKSEINGQLFVILKELGEMVSPQTPIAVIGSVETYVIQLQIDEYDISKVNLGQTCIVTLDSYAEKTFKAKITKIKPYLNERTKTFEIEARFLEVPKKLYPNLSLEANIITSKIENTLVIPRKFIMDNNYVMLENGKKKKVKFGLMNYEKAQVISGLNKNEIIVIPSNK